MADADRLLCASHPTRERRIVAITRIAYYDRIAKQWHRVTGHHGGAFKRYVLNDCLLGKIEGIAGRSILELGAGNGYFAAIMLRRFSGQQPARLVISDQSQAQLDTAQTTFFLQDAEYAQLDVQQTFPFADASFDLILAIMLLNELTNTALRAALCESRRVLAPGGRLLAAVPHPAFIHALARKGALTDFGHGLFIMPSAEGLRLPVSRRSEQMYLDTLGASGFAVVAEPISADAKTLHAKPGLKLPHATPLALVFDCRVADTSTPVPRPGGQSFS
ncbi:MAG TPA: class I SAM-dependent methyltransferase [Ktedonobacterales bacterium]|nr:class I SAM-dependent methyltransferase [Ktedonobacterales bacterium]